MSFVDAVLIPGALGAIVVGAVLLATRVARGARAELRFRLLLVGVVAATLLPALRALAPGLELPVLAAQPAAAGSPALPTFAAPEPARDLGWVLPAIWLAGVVLLLARLVADRRALARLERGARTLQDSEWRSLVTRLGSQLDLRRRVRLLVHPGVGSPVTWGTRRPAVLLPEEALSWSVDRRRAVLLHELEHVRRQDASVQTLVEVCCALRWFDPTTWIARRVLRRERELACDQRVVAMGARPSRYARLLLDLYRSLANRSATPSLAAVPFGLPRTRRRSELELRLGGLLEQGHGGERRAVWLTSIGLGLLLPFTTLTLIPRAASAAPMRALVDPVVEEAPPAAPITTAPVTTVTLDTATLEATPVEATAADPAPADPTTPPPTEQNLEQPAPTPGGPAPVVDSAPPPSAPPTIRDVSVPALLESLRDEEPALAFDGGPLSIRVFKVHVTR